MVPRACSVLGCERGEVSGMSRAGCRSIWCLWLSAAVGCTELFWGGTRCHTQFYACSAAALLNQEDKTHVQGNGVYKIRQSGE